MPELTPPWERIPLYITSFQSSPVRIYAKQTTGKSETWAGWENGEKSGPESFPPTPLLGHPAREGEKMSLPWIILNFLLLWKRILGIENRERALKGKILFLKLQSPVPPPPPLCQAHRNHSDQAVWSLPTCHQSCQSAAPETVSLWERAAWAPVLETWILVQPQILAK